MKYILSVDNLQHMLDKQKDELQQCIKDCDITDQVEIINFHFSYEDDHSLNKQSEEIIKEIMDNINSKKDELELVLDILLDECDSIGIDVLKKLLDNKRIKNLFISNQLLVTMVSNYLGSDFMYDCNKKIRSKEITSKIYYCYRPTTKNNEDVTFDKEKYAFPVYYFEFKDKVKNDKIIELLKKTTYYGNFFGLIISRLFCSENEEE